MHLPQQMCSRVILPLLAEKLPQAIDKERTRRLAVLARLSASQLEHLHDLTSAVRSELFLATSLLIRSVQTMGPSAAAQVTYSVMDRLHRWDGNGGKHHLSDGHNTKGKPQLPEGYIAPPQVEILLTVGGHSPGRLYCEIGFNAGHSAAALLAAYPQTSLLSFDLAEHSYVDAAERYVAQLFPGRHTLIRGPSSLTVPRMAQSNPHCDLIFIDGDHRYEGALADLQNIKALSSCATVIVMDDVDDKRVAAAWNTAIVNGWIKETKRGSASVLNTGSGMNVGQQRQYAFGTPLLTQCRS